MNIFILDFLKSLIIIIIQNHIIMMLHFQDIGQERMFIEIIYYAIFYWILSIQNIILHIILPSCLTRQSILLKFLK